MKSLIDGGRGAHFGQPRPFRFEVAEIAVNLVIRQRLQLHCVVQSAPVDQALKFLSAATYCHQDQAMLAAICAYRLYTSGAVRFGNFVEAIEE